MRVLFVFLVILTLITSVHAQIQLTAVPLGVGDTKEIQDANASLAGNWYAPSGNDAFASLHLDGRNDFLPRVRGGYAEVEIEVNAPRAVDKKSGKPKYKVVYQIGSGEVRYAEHLGGNKWLARFDLSDLRVGLQHLRFGLDGLVVGRGRPHFDIAFVRVHLPGKDIKEDRGIIGKLVVLGYEGATDAASIANFLIRRAQEYPLTQRVGWVDALDGNPVRSIFDQHRPQPIVGQDPPNREVPRKDPPKDLPDHEVEDFLAYSDSEAKTFVVQNNFRDRNLEVILEGTSEAGAEKQAPVLVKPGIRKNFRLSAISGRTKILFVVRDAKTGRILDRQRYSEGS